MAPDMYHAEFDKAGKKDGLQIWRIENMEVAPIPIKTYGNFFSGDAYIILRTKGTSWNLHFWLGSQSSQDEQGAAAMLATQLDDYLGGDPVQYRETQGNESSVFKSYFKAGLLYKEGGIASGFSHVETNTYDVRRLLHVKGRKTVQATEVPFAWSSFNVGDVFLVDMGKVILQWNGPESNRLERLKGTLLAKDIRDRERGGRGQVITIDGENENGSDKGFTALVKLLGNKPTKLNPATEDAVVSRAQLSQLKLFHVSDESGQLTVQEVATKPLTQDLLNHDDCYILDQGGNRVFVWKGKGASREERSGAMNRAIGYVQAKGYPSNTQIETVPDGAESAMFKQLFKGWKSKGETVGRGSTYTRGRIASVAHVKFDSESMHAQPHLAAQHRMVDDGSGEIEIWRVESNELAPVDKSTYGQFYGGDCYLLLYSYLSNNKKAYIIYFWQGRHATQDEIAASAFHAVALDDKYGGAPVQIRVVMGKEPKHFMAIFKGQLLIYEGGTSRNQEMPHPEPEVRLFQVRGTSELNTKAIEVDPRAASLNSNDVFLLKGPLQTYMWCGKGCSGDEREMGKNIAKVISSRDLETVSEGNEGMRFWAALGGKAPYANSVSLQQVEENDDQARLFECTNASGNFKCEEIYDFTQDDLDEDDVMLLDTFSEIFLWVGKGANEQEKKESVVAAINYLRTDPTGSRDPHTPIVTVKQGFEPPMFTGWFGAWDPSKWSGNKTYDDLKKELGGSDDLFDSVLASAAPHLAPASTNNHVSTATTGNFKVYSHEVLKSKTEDLPKDVDSTRREQHLSDQEFQIVFEMSKLEFAAKPAWKQSALKKTKELF